jgi:hypothetical protein
VWRHEALDFTPWIRANIDTLSEALGMELELPETEVPVGDSFCDAVVIIGVNQYPSEPRCITVPPYRLRTQ